MGVGRPLSIRDNFPSPSAGALHLKPTCKEKIGTANEAYFRAEFNTRYYIYVRLSIEKSIHITLSVQGRIRHRLKLG
jgi:hypothetical protein